MKLLALAVAATVVLLTGLTIWFGARAREDTVVAHPYEEGLALTQHHGGTSGAGSFTGEGGELEVVLELGPRPLEAMRELEAVVRLARGGAPVDGAEVRVSFAMPGMAMGENVVRLTPAGGGRYVGKAVLVRCGSGRRDWLATVAVRRGGDERRVDVPLRLGE